MERDLLTKPPLAPQVLSELHNDHSWQNTSRPLGVLLHKLNIPSQIFRESPSPIILFGCQPYIRYFNGY